MSKKMTLGEWFDRVRDPLTSDSEVMSISKIEKGAGAFDFSIVPDPRYVDVPAEEADLESAMRIGNGLSRRRRAASFHLRQLRGDPSPVLVSEMDSWGQFPLLIDEIIDHLNRDYLIWSVGAAGDTAQNMVFGPQKRGGREYMKALRRHNEEARAFLFSAAGNDIIGEDPETERPVILDLLKEFNGDPDDVKGHIDLELLDRKLNFLRDAYENVVATIRADAWFERLPIILHGYDYCFPYPFGNDTRDPIYAEPDEWLGGPMAERGIPTETLGRAIVRYLIDRLYEMLGGLAGQSSLTGVWLVDCRGAMPERTDWADEIHGTSAGFAKVAERFRSVLNEALSQVA